VTSLLSRGCIEGTDPAQSGEAGFRVESFGIVSCSHQQRRGDLESDAWPGKELGADESRES
jgi:hypothetical protein